MSLAGSNIKPHTSVLHVVKELTSVLYFYPFFFMKSERGRLKFSKDFQKFVCHNLHENELGSVITILKFSIPVEIL